MHGQIQPTIATPRSVQVQQEVQNFLQALDSYPASPGNPTSAFTSICAAYSPGLAISDATPAVIANNRAGHPI